MQIKIAMANLITTQYLKITIIKAIIYTYSPHNVIFCLIKQYLMV